MSDPIQLAEIKRRVEQAQALLVTALRAWDDLIQASPSLPLPSPPAEPIAPEGTRLIPWSTTVSREFLMSVIWIEEQLGLRADFLMVCMKFESNLRPDAKNPYSSGSGLIQFMEPTAKRLGTTTAALRKMSGTRQLSYVYKYFKEYADRGFDLSKWTLNDTYMAILWPAGIGKPDSFQVFVDDPKKLKDVYDVNKGLDIDRDGFITKAEACAKVNKLYQQGLDPANVSPL